MGKGGLIIREGWAYYKNRLPIGEIIGEAGGLNRTFTVITYLLSP